VFAADHAMASRVRVVVDDLVANLPLMSLAMIWVVAADHPLASRGRVGVEDLAASPVFSYARNSRPFVELRDALTNAGIRSPRLFSSNALSASIGMTKAGLGICTLPDVVARPHIEQGDVVRIETDIPLNDLRFTASFLNDTASGLAKSAAAMAARIAADFKA
ncbi:MAG: substrate-binding domain-containing protein, partial [Pseudomonadota bacterium]